jgi:hypothetical protein
MSPLLHLHGIGTLVRYLRNTDIREGQSGYEQGWRATSFDPMRARFTQS